MNAQAELGRLIRSEAVMADPQRAEALRKLAQTVDALPGDDRTSRVLHRLRPYEQREFPNERLRALISSYGAPTLDQQGFLNGVVEAIHPGVGSPEKFSGKLLEPGESEAWYQAVIRLVAGAAGLASGIGFLVWGSVPQYVAGMLIFAGGFGAMALGGIWIILRDRRRRSTSLNRIERQRLG